jgi:hypothetical protein
LIFVLFLELERDNVLMLLRKSAMVENEPYDEESIFEESEMMNVGIAENSGNGESRKVSTHLDPKGIAAIELSQMGRLNMSRNELQFYTI